jgi:hypothetical protein
MCERPSPVGPYAQTNMLIQISITLELYILPLLRILRRAVYKFLHKESGEHNKTILQCSSIHHKSRLRLEDDDHVHRDVFMEGCVLQI